MINSNDWMSPKTLDSLLCARKSCSCHSACNSRQRASKTALLSLALCLTKRNHAASVNCTVSPQTQCPMRPGASQHKTASCPWCTHLAQQPVCSSQRRSKPCEWSDAAAEPNGATSPRHIQAAICAKGTVTGTEQMRQHSRSCTTTYHLGCSCM